MNKRKILVRGPALSRSGYGEHCRTVLRALRSDDRNEVYLLNVGWGHSGWIAEDTEEREWIDNTIMNTARVIQSGVRDFSTSVQVQLPSEWQKLCEYNIGITAGVETTSAPEDWNTACLEMDRVIVPSQHSKECFSENVQGIVEIINFPARVIKSKKVDFNLETDFNFLTVAQWNPRKNLEQTISSFIQEFQNEEVGLIIKTGIAGGSHIDREQTRERLQLLLNHSTQNRKCKVYLFHGSLSDGEMVSLYKSKNISAYITTSHGEGFGLPVFEAAQYGVPVIAPNWGGIRDFSGDSFIELEYEEKELEEHQVWEGVLEADSRWCFPKTTAVRSQMREVYNNISKYKKQAKAHQNFISENFSEQSINLCYNNVIDDVLKVTETLGDKNETE